MLLAPMALETSRDAQEAKATIERVNVLYGSIYRLYQAIGVCQPGLESDSVLSTAQKPCSKTAGLARTGGGYAAETLGYDVQSDLYFLAKSLIVNLDLDEVAENLISPNPASVLGLLNRSKELFPVIRRGAATYRDGIVLFSDMAANTCEPKSDATSACGKLRKALSEKYEKGRQAGSSRDLANLFGMAQRASAQSDWSLGAAQRSAIVFHIDKACAYAFDLQRLGGDVVDPANCGDPTPKKPVAKNRGSFLGL